MKRLFLLMVFLAASIQSDAAKMSSYTENTTPNDDVYFIGVDPNDTTQTVNGSNYRYSLSSILGSGLLDFNVNSLTVSGTGDSWLELNNNASFAGSLIGKYGYSFLTANPTAIINGTPSRLALYSELGATSISEGSATADPSTMTTGEIYIETDTGNTTIKTALGSVEIAGTYTADPIYYTLTVTDPGNGDVIASTDTFIDCGDGATDCTHDYEADSTPELTATPAAGREFTAWTGDATDTSTTTNPDTITMDAAKSVSATFSVAASGLEDTFTDTDSTLLSAHTADTSHTWAQVGTSTVNITSNAAHSVASAGFGMYRSSYTPADADYTVSATVTATSGATSLILMARCSTSATTGYGLRFGNGKWIVSKTIAGTTTQIAEYTGAVPTAAVAELVVSGTSLVAKINGVAIITTTDADITSAGVPGIGAYYASVPSYIDNYEVTE